MMKINKKFTLVIGILLALIVGTFFLSLNMGSFSIGPMEILHTFAGQGTRQQEIVLFTMRLPRIVIAIFVGAALATAGAILQGMTKNDLAEPGILGISSGSSLAVVLFIYFMNGSAYYKMSVSTIYAMPIAAFIGAAVSAVLIYRLAWKDGLSTTRLLLIGIGINAAFHAIIIIFQLRFSTQDFNRILVWTSGSLWGTSWNYVLAVAPWIFLFLCFTIYKARYLDILNLGESLPVGLGVNVERERKLLLMFVVVLSGLATAVAGTISFLGLIAPHIARRLVGPKHKVLLPTAMLVGILMLMLGDTIARNILNAIELPVGIVVSIIGVPYFIYLMMKE